MAALLTLFPADGESPSAHGGPPWRKTVGFWIGIVSLFFLALAASLTVWAVVPALLPPWESSIVASGSMAPRIKTGDVVVWRTEVPSDVGDGSVLVYLDNKQQSIIHRVIGHTPDGNLRMKGDANAQADTDPVAPAQLLGWGQVLVPLIGTPGVLYRNHKYLELIGLIFAAAAAVWSARRVWDPRFDTWRGADGLVLEGSGLAEPVRLSAARRHHDPMADDEQPALLPDALRAVVVAANQGDRS